ncbi:MAG: DEAD/DEAH box helicase [Vulcanimicrobiaceae bacterium]
MSNAVADVLRLWYLIEILSPQAVTFRDPDYEYSTDFAITPGAEVPWSELSARQESLFGAVPDTDEEADEIEDLARADRPSAAFLVYLGISKIALFDRAIVAAGGTERTALDQERESKESCAFATIHLDEEGVYIDDSLVLSTLPWGLQQLRALKIFEFVRRPKPKDFDEFVDRLKANIPLPRRRPLAADDICRAAEFVREACKLEKVIPFEKPAHGTFYKLGLKEPRDLLNSFYYRDIIHVMRLHAEGKMPAILRHIFSEPNIQSRVDLFHDVSKLRCLVRPTVFPAGAWPNVNMKPALMQQAALILADRLDESSPVLAVNGPPGTGKTTMIRSLVADQVVQRARRLCGCGNSSDWRFVPDEGDPESGYHRPPEDVTGFEIVVASSNNGAVENISDELPDVKSVAGFAQTLSHELHDYFLPVARNVARYRGGKRKRDAWGLIAASLGNKKKRRAFIEPFLFNQNSRRRPPGHLTIREFHRGRHKVDWNEACSDFCAAYERFEDLRSRSSADDAAFWLGDIKERHDQVPGLSPELLLSQQELFVKALRVHRAFIGRNWRKINDNLHAWARVARMPQTCPAEKALALWQTFFLVVPVVSTTFASAARMLGRVTALGWVVVDEAGQAVPQAALGLLMRAKRAIVVGDPLQLEPVVTLSSAVIGMFRDILQVDAQWVAANDTSSSLQTIVERVSPWGSYRQTKSKRTQWIGVPLVVHRRCLEPMFGVSNEVVYGGDMLYRTEPCPALNLYPFGESAWIDERSLCNGRHAVNAQIDLALLIVRAMYLHFDNERNKLIPERHGLVSEEEMANLREMFAEPDIRVITPFREIEGRFVELATKIPRQPARWRKWCEDHVGTVHKVQGKEAGLIICVLGLDHATSGAADFATAKPNFLNVAITRAKHRLYVIGNASVWRYKDYFRDLYGAFEENDAVASAAEFRARCSLPAGAVTSVEETRLPLMAAGEKQPPAST